METVAPLAALGLRQIWSTPTSRAHPPHCTAFDLPANGILVLNATATVTLQADAVFQPFCSDISAVNENNTLPISDFLDPFVASTVPQIFVIGAMLEISWMLVVILFITPRTSFVVGSETGFLGRGGILGRSYGSSSVIGVGGRPLLQKVAALMVFVSMLIATVNSMNLAQYQYSQGYEDAVSLTVDVVGSLEIRVIRIISETFLWLAQVQTLIRLFPRHKEKVVIKWTGFALVLLDTLFSILDNFLADTDGESIMKPRYVSGVIPALSYLFQLALSFVYACSVVYYSLVKRRFAYYHKKMRNICLVAFLSLIAISIPVVFFVLDVAQPLLIGWGDYVCWVGAAAASVVVWEWVERIEALEREERKEGILGREIFDGDEAYDSINSSESRWPNRRNRRQPPGGHDNYGGASRSGFVSSSDAKTKFAVSSIMKRVTRPDRADSQRRRRQSYLSHGPGELTDSTGVVSSITPRSTGQASFASRAATSGVYSTDGTLYDGSRQTADAELEFEHPSTTPDIPRAQTGASQTTTDTNTAPVSHSPTSIHSGRFPSALQRPKDLARRYMNFNLARRGTRGERSSSPAVPSPVSASSSPSATSTPPAVRPTSTTSSRIFSRLRHSAAEQPNDLPLYVIRSGQGDGDELVIEPKSEDDISNCRSSSAEAFTSQPRYHSSLATDVRPSDPEYRPRTLSGSPVANSQPPHAVATPSSSHERDELPPPFNEGSSPAPTPPRSRISERAAQGSPASGSRTSRNSMPVLREDEAVTDEGGYGERALSRDP